MMAAVQPTRITQAPTRLRSDSAKKEATETLEKDDVELRLEKALFGDDAGFLESLTRQVVQDDRAPARSRQAEVGDSGDDDDNGGEEEDFSGVPDEDVSPRRVPNSVQTNC